MGLRRGPENITLGEMKKTMTKLGHWEQRVVQLGQSSGLLQGSNEKHDGKVRSSGDITVSLQY